MILLDVNVLVTAHREDAEHHWEIKSWLGIGPARAGGSGGLGAGLERLPAGYHASENL